MKLLAIFALVAVATAQPVDPQNERLVGIIGAIINALKPQPPISVGPAIVENSPIHVGPAIIEGSPINIGPAIIEDFPIQVGPAIVEDHFSPPHVEPAFVDQTKPPKPTKPFVYNSPLVQIIVKVNSKPSPVELPEIKPTPIEIVDLPEVPEEIIVAPIVIPEEVIVAPIEIPEIKPEPVIIAPIEVEPVNIPGELN